MKAYMEERITTLASYIIENKATVRETAKQFGVSKSSVHKDVAERLWEINRPMARMVKSVLQENKAERHIRGGRATKEKYRKMKQCKKAQDLNLLG